VHRHALSDEQWERIRRFLPDKRTGPESTRGDRLFIDAVLYRAKTGVAWRDLPERFGPWKSVYNRFSNWAKRGVWARIFKALQFEVDETGTIIDASVVRAHQDASGGKGGSNAMLWGALEEAFQASSTRSLTRKRGRSTSKSRRASSTTRR
jgi:transposase